MQIVPVLGKAGDRYRFSMLVTTDYMNINCGIRWIDLFIMLLIVLFACFFVIVAIPVTVTLFLLLGSIWTPVGK